MKTKPDRRYVEKGPYGHIHFKGKPCEVCGQSLGSKGVRIIWEFRYTYMRGDDVLYGCHEHCEPKMLDTLQAKWKQAKEPQR